MSAVWEFPWEKAAAEGLELPDGLTQADQMAFLALRSVYAEFYAKRLTPDRAGREKRKLRRAWEKAREAEAFEKRLMEYHVRLIRATERAACACRKEPTEENAIRLCDVLDGIERPELPSDWEFGKRGITS